MSKHKLISNSKNLNFWFLLKLLFSIVSIGIIFRFILRHFESFYEGIQDIRFLFMAFLIPIVINPIFSNLRWRVFLILFDVQIKFLSLIKISFKAFFLSLALPSSLGYDLTRLVLIEKETNVNISNNGASIFFDRLIALLVLSISAFASSILILRNENLYSFTLFTSTVLVSISLFIYFLRTNLFISIIKNSLLKWKKFFKFGEGLIHFFELVRKEHFSRIINLKVVVFIFLFQFSNIICTLLIFKSLDINIPYYFHFAILPIIWIITIIPVTLSGIGLREGAFVYFYGTVGVGSDKALIASLLTFLLLIVTPAIIGSFLLITDKK
jgi:uncharacterized protein (TIRG00374 family)